MKSVGYFHLEQKYSLALYPYWVISQIGPGRKTIQKPNGRYVEIYPKKYWPGDSDLDHLQFALNREGLHLELLRKVLPLIAQDEITTYISKKPTGKISRIIWYLYEEITGNLLPLADLETKVRFVPLLDKNQYFVGPERVISRHRLRINLLGTMKFSVFIRRVDELVQWEKKDLQQACHDFVGSISPELFHRVRDYLYTKETKSSFAIERVTPKASRAERFARLLIESADQDYLTKESLVDLQGKIVEDAYVANDYRDIESEQVYVGESISITDTRVHFVAPRQEDISTLMDDFLQSCGLIMASSIPAIAKASAISYVFVFLHPFPDGNGRIHRFLIHHVLSKSNFTSEGMIFPISAVMLNNPLKYDESLESYSHDLLQLVDYELDERGRMTVLNETESFYRYIDVTKICSYLYWFVEEAIKTEMPAEVEFLSSYDQARNEIREIFDMPNRIADLFIRLCLQNEGTLSIRKRKMEEFEQIKEETIEELEKAVQKAFTIK